MAGMVFARPTREIARIEGPDAVHRYTRRTMLRFTVFDQHGPASEWPLRRAHVLGANDATFPAKVHFEAGHVVVRPSESRTPVALCLEFDAGKAGVLMLQTTVLQQRDEAYGLFEELARHRIKIFLEKSESWGLLDPGRAPEAFELFERARLAFVAGFTEHDPWKAQQRQLESIALGIRAGELLTKVRTERALQQRFAAQGTPRALGFRAPLEKAPDLLKQCLSPEFDAVMLPVPWQAIEPQQGRFQWDQLDRWVVWAKASRRAMMLGPLLDLRPGGIPGWVLPSLQDLPKLEQHLYRFVREVVIRYAPVDPTWHIAAGVNSNEVAALTAAQMTQLVRHVAVTVRQVVPEARVLVEASDPFGERSSADNGAIGAVQFVRMLVSEGVKLSSVGIPIVMGDPATGTRDLMRMADMLDRFVSRNEMPILVVSALDAPSAPRADPGAGSWHKPWAEDVQAAWAQMAFQLAISQRKVALVIWDRLRDDAGVGLRDGGLFGAGGAPKQAARSLLLARRRIRQPLVAKATENA